VNESSNSRFHALLVAFDRITDCPILLNTSFNLRGEPIALDPADAVWTFAISKIDTLVVEDWLVDRGEQPWSLGQIIAMMGARSTKRRSTADSLNVYTFI
jgi:carbamoyltransferase